MYLDGGLIHIYVFGCLCRPHHRISHRGSRGHTFENAHPAAVCCGDELQLGEDFARGAIPCFLNEREEPRHRGLRHAETVEQFPFPRIALRTRFHVVMVGVGGGRGGVSYIVILISLISLFVAIRVRDSSAPYISTFILCSLFR